MKRNRRVSVALHVLVHLAERPNAARTSEDLARCIGTNPVVVRRTLAGMREAGFVSSVAGPGGGWTLGRDPHEMSVGEVCTALGERLLFAIELGAPSGCRVQAAVNGALDDFVHDAEALLLARLDRVSIASLASRVHAARQSSHQLSA